MTTLDDYSQAVKMFGIDNLSPYYEKIRYETNIHDISDLWGSLKPREKDSVKKFVAEYKIKAIRLD